MLRRTRVSGGEQVEFIVESTAPVSVVGDFNDWDPDRGALAPGRDDSLTWSTFLPVGRYAFRYLRDGEFFDDPHADAYEANGYGQYHGVLIVEAPAAPIGTKARAEPKTAADKPTATTTPRKPRT